MRCQALGKHTQAVRVECLNGMGEDVLERVRGGYVWALDWLGQAGGLVMGAAGVQKTKKRKLEDDGSLWMSFFLFFFSWKEQRLKLHT